MTRQPFRDAAHAALARTDVLEQENERLRAELASAHAALVEQELVSRALSPHRVFVRSMLLAASLVAVALLVALGLACHR